jgi:hypothetical protein
MARGYSASEGVFDARKEPNKINDAALRIDSIKGKINEKIDNDGYVKKLEDIPVVKQLSKDLEEAKKNMFSSIPSRDLKAILKKLPFYMQEYVIPESVATNGDLYESKKYIVRTDYEGGSYEANQKSLIDIRNAIFDELGKFEKREEDALQAGGFEVVAGGNKYQVEWEHRKAKINEGPKQFLRFNRVNIKLNGQLNGINFVDGGID